MPVSIDMILTNEDLVRERTPKELFNWVQQKALELSSYEELKEYVLLRKGLCDKFYTEVYPLSLLAIKLYPNRSDIVCKPNLSNDNFDARIIDYSTKPSNIHKIEFTQAIEGHKEHLRTLKFIEDEWVLPLGEVIHTGTKRTGYKISIPNIAVERGEIVNKELRLILERARGKSQRLYGKDTSLVIVFDDYVAFRPDDKRSKDEISELEVFTKKEVLPLRLDFDKLYLLGWSGKTLLKFSC